MSLNEQCNNSDAHAMWQAWQAQAKPSRVELLSEEKIDPVVLAHMTLEESSRNNEGSFAFVLEECRLDNAEWEQHCTRQASMEFRCDDGGLGMVPLRRSSHT